ncbi:MAG: CDP-diacylglycerol--glycerol-3-phosphate 3-phosphatidyltransferase [Malacoplasma sp.]|nr:CDP-diacylglycerol--glycerol-3-phosphate 3-phosphatidyltransferase [Malacoplasma sp.]
MNKQKYAIIPNILTIFRIGLTVVIVILMFFNQNDNLYFFTINNGYFTNTYKTLFASGVLFIIASISDFLDGFLARKYHWVSDFGKIWDPIADKVLTTSVYICFAVLGFVPFYFVIIMFFRDLVIDGYRIQAGKYGIVVPANMYGKVKAVLQMFSIILIFFAFNFPGGFTSNNVFYYLVQNLLVILATIVSLVSGVIYILQIENKKKLIKLNE